MAKDIVSLYLCSHQIDGLRLQDTEDAKFGGLVGTNISATA